MEQKHRSGKEKFVHFTDSKICALKAKIRCTEINKMTDLHKDRKTLESVVLCINSYKQQQLLLRDETLTKTFQLSDATPLAM